MGGWVAQSPVGAPQCWHGASGHLSAQFPEVTAILCNSLRTWPSDVRDFSEIKKVIDQTREFVEINIGTNINAN